MVRLRTVSPNDRGWARRRAGKGFVYLDSNGDRLGPGDVERIRSLVIPPAWEDVWISPHPNGHVQAVGTDAAGRRQYLYHPVWRVKRDELKFDRVVAAARRLPAARIELIGHLSSPGMTLERAAATAVRLLDLGYFRIGGDAYADNGAFGLTTLKRRHVLRRGGALVFCFVGKSGIEHTIEIDDAATIDSVEVMRRRRGGGDQLMAYRTTRRWADLNAAHVNEYLRDATGEDLTAKDFRTWHATVLAAAALADAAPAETEGARKRVVRAAMVEVSEFLGNTPTIARSSYVDPRVIDLWHDGITIERATKRRYADADARQAGLEQAVRRMLSRAPGARPRNHPR